MACRVGKSTRQGDINCDVPCNLALVCRLLDDVPLNSWPRQIPENISVLSTLQVLALDNNDLRSVPATVGDLPELQTLLLRWACGCAAASSVGGIRRAPYSASQQI